MFSVSHWASTKTFFPMLLAELERRGNVGSACVVGASDGKFVLPLARAGWHVTALDVDQVALFGGDVEFPQGNFTLSPGLIGRLKEACLEKKVDIVLGDLYEFRPLHEFDVIFTSCSWHYSRNHHRPVGEYVRKMQECIVPGGLFCAEYMMPVEAKHFASEHYLYQGQVRRYFSDDWHILEEFYTPPFRESAHLGNLNDHVHQMGFFLAQKAAPLA